MDKCRHESSPRFCSMTLIARDKRGYQCYYHHSCDHSHHWFCRYLPPGDLAFRRPDLKSRKSSRGRCHPFVFFAVMRRLRWQCFDVSLSAVCLLPTHTRPWTSWRACGAWAPSSGTQTSCSASTCADTPCVRTASKWRSWKVNRQRSRSDTNSRTLSADGSFSEICFLLFSIESPSSNGTIFDFPLLPPFTINVGSTLT